MFLTFLFLIILPVSIGIIQTNNLVDEIKKNQLDNVESNFNLIFELLKSLDKQFHDDLENTKKLIEKDIKNADFY
ncbi:MAG: hypothetical protein PWP54_1613 [Thermosipho sp. (in: thermotogales)]|nr:hypothetical protein [Thermosipho sp. (in: thermotogales)]